MKYCLIVLLSLVTLNAFAQKFGVQAKIGGGFASQKIDNKDVIGVNSIGTVNFGGVVTYALAHRFELQSGLDIANKGARVTEDGITTTQRITYLDIPLNITKNFNFPGLGILYVGVGGYAGRGLSGRNKYETPNSTTSYKLEFGNSGDVQRFDEGLNFTTGLKLNNSLLFDVRYAYGLKNVSTYPLRDTGTSTVKNRILTISLGYVIK